MMSPVGAARVYLRVSTDEQDLTRQEAIVAGARASGYYVAAVYCEKASGARSDRPELLRMVADLQPGEVIGAEKIDRISRLPLAEAELLAATIRAKGARLAVPGIVDLSDLVADSAGVARLVLEAVQDMLLRVALQTARDDDETRRERQREEIEIAKRAGRSRSGSALCALCGEDAYAACDKASITRHSATVVVSQDPPHAAISARSVARSASLRSISSIWSAAIASASAHDPRGSSASRSSDRT